MASQFRQNTHALIEELRETPETFDFFRALRIVEASRPDSPRLGTSKNLQGDPMRFGQFLSMAFATSALAVPQVETTHPKLAIRFAGLTGPNGPLPLRITEFLWNRLKGNYDADLKGTKADTSEKYGYVSPRDAAAVQFLDIFHHRIISLFYRAWAVCQKTADLDRPTEQRFSEWIASLAGLGLPELNGMDGIPTRHRLPFTGFLANQSRHPHGLQQILKTYFRTPAQVETFVGHWIRLPEDQWCRLGESTATGVLGRTCVVGSRIWDTGSKFRVFLGPMNVTHFSTFLNGAAGHARLHEWINFYARQEFYWEAVIILKKEDIPPTRLGKTGSGQLGRNCWAMSRTPEKDSHDYRIRGGGLTAAENS